MDFDFLLTHILIGIGAVIFGVASGRAKAERLRELGRDLTAGRTRGYVIVGAVALLSVVPLLGSLR